MAASDAIQNAMAIVHQPADQVEVDRYISDLKALLPPAGYATAWEAGRSLAVQGLEAVLAFALEIEQQVDNSL